MDPVWFLGCIPKGRCSSPASPKDNGGAILEVKALRVSWLHGNTETALCDPSLRPGLNSKSPCPTEAQVSPCLTPTPAYAANVKSFRLAVPAICGHVYGYNESRCWRLNTSVLTQPQMPATVHPQHGFLETTVITSWTNDKIDCPWNPRPDV